MFDVTYLGALLAGLLSFLSPCILPIVPFYLSYLAGVGMNQISAQADITPQVRLRAFMAACCFALGVITVFMGLGATATAFGQMVREYFDILRWVAAAVIIASEAAVEKYGLTPKARVSGMATIGVPPRIMGIGPAPATEKLMAQHGLSIGDIDLIELNEAFAAQGLAVTRQLGLPDDADHVNPHGGAIALGHPVGATGAIITVKAMYELERIQGSKALITMCIGGGQGIALAIERL